MSKLFFKNYFTPKQTEKNIAAKNIKGKEERTWH
jgi:hypothetical protein